MSRFDMSRRGRILAWTGAALAWGTAVTIAWLEPASAEAHGLDEAAAGSTIAVVPASQLGTMPTLPTGGLVILKYQPSTNLTPPVRTVYVQQEAPQAPSTQAPPGPAPRSSGS